ncbi:MAG: DMT family transporter, partial [Desulfobacterales bacterium]
MSSKNSETSGALMVSAGAVLISFSAVFVKLAHVSPTMAGFYRTFFGGIILLVILVIRREALWKGAFFLTLGVFCGVVFALDLFFWHLSIHFVGPGLATILANFQVFLLALYGVLVLKEPVNWRTVLAIPLAVFGLFLLAGVHWRQLGEIYRLGVVSGLATAGCYAVYILALRRLQSEKNAPSAMANLAVISLVSALILGAAAWLRADRFTIPDTQSLLSLAGYGLFSQVIGWVLITRGLTRLRSSLVGLLILLQPALSFTWDILFFHRETDLYGACGAMLALTAIYLGTTAGARKKT